MPFSTFFDRISEPLRAAADEAPAASSSEIPGAAVRVFLDGPMQGPGSRHGVRWLAGLARFLLYFCLGHDMWIRLGLGMMLSSSTALAMAAAVSVPIHSAANASAWTIDAQGLAGPAQQLGPFPNYISVSSNGDGSGTAFAAGFDAYSWDGVWSATYRFELPADATNIRLVIDQIEADDKIVVSLNGSVIPNASYVVSNSTGTGSFNFGTGQVPFEFPGFTPGIQASTGFQAGAQNSLTLFVNNTGSTDPAAPSAPLIAGVDGTTATFSGQLSYITAVPEPSGMSLLVFGMAAVSAALRVDKSARPKLPSAS